MYTGLPAQKLPLTKKGEIWKKDTIDYYIRMSYTTTIGNRTSNYNKLINYDLFNGKFNKADLEYVCNPLGMSDNEFPAQLQHYDIISEPLRLLISEEAKRPDNCSVISESTKDINRKQEALKGRILQSLQTLLMGEIDPSTVDPNNPPPLPEEILRLERHTPSDMIESKANKTLKYLRKKLVTKEVFKKGWKDALIAGEEIYWVGIQNGEPMARRCNPVNITVVLDADSDFIDDAIAVVETRLLSPSTIIDEYGEELSSAQVTQIEQMNRQYATTYNWAMGPNPTFTMTNNGVMDTNIAPTFSQYGSSSGAYNQHLIRVSRVEWKSFKKLYYLTFTDENGQEIERMVDESFAIDLFKKQFPEAKIEETWINEAWEGVKIGNDIYINARPKPNQRRRMDNPYVCKLGYTGLVYSATNSQSVSLVDRLKPYQYLYNIIMYRLELAFASDQGKIMLMDLAQIPRSEGIDIERWMYYLKAMKIAFVNSFEEGRKGVATGKLSNFNQFQSIDMSLANQISQYISTLEYIKNQTYFVSGVTPQRMGAISSNELVGNVERSVSQSALITEYLFDSHDEVKRRTYQALVEVAKIAWKDGHVAQFVLDDMSIELLQIEELEFEDSEFGVFMTNSNKDLAVTETLKQMFQVALQSDKINLSTMVETITNDSPREMLRTLQRGEAEKQQRDQQMQQMQMEAQQKQVEAQQQMHLEDMQFEQQKLNLQQYIADSNNETRIQVAEIQVYSRQENLDLDQDGIPDPIELASLSMQERAQSSKQFMEQNKLFVQKETKDRELSLREKEMQMKKELEDKKIEAIRVQNKSQEKIAAEQIRLKKKEMENKMKIEKLKQSKKK